MNYYSKVVFDFLNYREYKQRCEYIEKTTNDIPSWVVRHLADRGMGIDYSKDKPVLCLWPPPLNPDLTM